ncbi:MAG: hypothetical protein VX265_05030 [Myxococcota bacterium]|nr:hypothetical protein [Myxococcota bacterium]
MQLPVTLVPIAPPPRTQRVRRSARLPDDGEKPNRYHLPRGLQSGSPVGYRTRMALRGEQVRAAELLLSLPRPTTFAPDAPAPTEQALFEELSLGLLSSRQSTNYRGFRQVTLGPDDSAKATRLLGQLDRREGPALPNATHTHIVLGQPYRTPFTQLLTFVGHKPVQSILSVPWRAWSKWRRNAVDIPTIGYLVHLHAGILAEAYERAAVLASAGRRAANVMMAPFAGADVRAENAAEIRGLEDLAGLSSADRRRGWGVQLVVQVGGLPTPLDVPQEAARRLAASVLAMRSERIQPGVNNEAKAPAAYQVRQDMDIPAALGEMCGRAAYNAMVHWTGLERAAAKRTLLLDRVDVLTPGGKGHLRQIRGELEAVTDKVVETLPSWADLPSGRFLSRNAERGRKAFALAGQRIYIGGLDRGDIDRLGIPWEGAIRAAGAAAARSALTAELAGLIDLPDDCDLLAGVCLMAGPVNQNDIGKQFFGCADLLARAHPDRDPTALLVWTLKAKTISDPLGNEEQLLNPARKGALVDLRAAPHEVASVRTTDGVIRPVRNVGGRTSTERAFADQGNFVTAPDGTDIPGNRGTRWNATGDGGPVW